MSYISAIKKPFIPKGMKARKIWSGLCKGLVMNIDLEHKTQFNLGLYEIENQRYLKLLAAGTQTIIDVGASFGQESLYFLSKTEAKIFAFEPVEEHRQELLANLDLNRLHDPRRFFLSEKFVGNSTADNTVALDSLKDKIILPCLVKMDIEGAETEVLKGAEKVLKMDKMRWLIEVHSRTLEQQCLSVFKKAGYHTKVISQAWWRFIIPEVRPVENRWLLAWRDSESPGFK